MSIVLVLNEYDWHKIKSWYNFINKNTSTLLLSSLLFSSFPFYSLPFHSILSIRLDIIALFPYTFSFFFFNVMKMTIIEQWLLKWNHHACVVLCCVVCKLNTHTYDSLVKLLKLIHYFYQFKIHKFENLNA